MSVIYNNIILWYIILINAFTDMIYNRFNVALSTRARGDTVFLQRATKLFDLYYIIMLCTGTTVLALPNHVCSSVLFFNFSGLTR